MIAVEEAVKNALEAHGDTQIANKAYLEFLKANFIIPVDKYSSDEDPVVLFLPHEHTTFLPVFSRIEYLNQWAADIHDSIKVLYLTGVNLLQGIGENITVCFNIDTPYYKEFNPSEIARMRSMMLKIGLIKT